MCLVYMPTLERIWDVVKAHPVEKAEAKAVGKPLGHMDTRSRSRFAKPLCEAECGQASSLLLWIKAEITVRTPWKATKKRRQNQHCDSSGDARSRTVDAVFELRMFWRCLWALEASEKADCSQRLPGIPSCRTPPSRKCRRGQATCFAEEWEFIWGL